MVIFLTFFDSRGWSWIALYTFLGFIQNVKILKNSVKRKTNSPALKFIIFIYVGAVHKNFLIIHLAEHIIMKRIWHNCTSNYRKVLSTGVFIRCDAESRTKGEQTKEINEPLFGS